MQRRRRACVPGDMSVRVRSDVDISPTGRILGNVCHDVLTAVELVAVLQQLLTAVHDAVAVEIHKPAVHHIVHAVICHCLRHLKSCLEVSEGKALTCRILLQNIGLKAVRSRSVCDHILRNFRIRCVCKRRLFGTADRIEAAVELDRSPCTRIADITVSDLQVIRRHLCAVVKACIKERCTRRNRICRRACRMCASGCRNRQIAIVVRCRKRGRIDHGIDCRIRDLRICKRKTGRCSRELNVL